MVQNRLTGFCNTLHTMAQPISINNGCIIHNPPTGFRITLYITARLGCLVFQGPVFLIFDISQQWLDRIFLSKGGPPIISDSLSTPKFCDYLDSGWVKSFHPRENRPVFCNFYLLYYFGEFQDFSQIYNIAF